MFTNKFVIILFLIGFLNSCSLVASDDKVLAPAAVLPIPSANQLEWQQMEFYGFIHFSLNTYTDQSWGYGNEDLNLFNPQELDAREWVKTAKDAGMKGIILTAKHHNGFALWPSKYTEYSVKNTPWKNGKGDLVKEVADACKEYGLKFGIYLSPWDRNRADYGKKEYITYFRNQLTELLTNYGPIFEVWFDGANGGTGYYGGANENRVIDKTTYYDWKNTYDLVRRLQPDAVIWNDGGERGDLRWVGTEAGFVGETNWSLLNSTGDVEWSMLHYGLEKGNAWVAAEVNTSIRPEWFYHPAEDAKVKSVSKLVDTYYNSVGRNASLLLNFPIMPNGKIHPTDAHNVIQMGNIVRDTFVDNIAKKSKITASNTRHQNSRFGTANLVDGNATTYWATDDNAKQASIEFDFSKPQQINRFLIQENIALGQRVKSFKLEALVNDKWIELTAGTTIGYKRILRFPSVSVNKVRLLINDAKASPVISNLGFYNAPVILNPPTITRNKEGLVTLVTDDIGPAIFYTLDGTNPDKNAVKYSTPFLMASNVIVKAISFDELTQRYSDVAVESFNFSKQHWTTPGIDHEKVNMIFDGDLNTSWHQENSKPYPIDLVVKLNQTMKISGFKYYPDQTIWGPGMITHYEFFISSDGSHWKSVSAGEFSNIKNNPVMQIKTFDPVNASFVKLRALGNTESNNNNIGYAEFDLIVDK
jgi:alpha-L-fucosidase